MTEKQGRVEITFFAKTMESGRVIKPITTASVSDKPSRADTPSPDETQLRLPLTHRYKFVKKRFNAPVIPPKAILDIKLTPAAWKIIGTRTLPNTGPENDRALAAHHKPPPPLLPTIQDEKFTIQPPFCTTVYHKMAIILH